MDAAVPFGSCVRAGERRFRLAKTQRDVDTIDVLMK